MSVATMYNLRPYIPTNLLPKITPAHTHRPHWVYILEIKLPDTILYKIGLSSNIAKRVNGLKSLEKPSSKVRGKGVILESITCIATVALSNCTQAGVYEQYLLEQYKEYKYTGEPILPSGNTELFTTNVLSRIIADAVSPR